MTNVVLYDTACSWEVDFVCKRLLAGYVTENFMFRFMNTKALLQYTDTSHQHLILVFSSNTLTYAELEPVVKLLKPKAVIHLSDEWGTKPEFVKLHQWTNLVLRQHWFPKVYEPHDNIKQLPLGFMVGFPLDLPIKPASERSIVWSFIGTINPPRKAMIDVLQSELKDVQSVVRGGGIKVAVMAEIYSQSVFVTNERGAIRYDCFRIYEALQVGAIPVLVGSKEELQETFTFEGVDDFPPWVCCDSWKQAATTCQMLIADKPRLDALQQTNIDWYEKHVVLAQKRIVEALEK